MEVRIVRDLMCLSDSTQLMLVVILAVALFVCYTIVLWTLAYENGKLKVQVKQQEEEINRLKIARNIAMRDED